MRPRGYLTIYLIIVLLSVIAIGAAQKANSNESSGSKDSNSSSSESSHEKEDSGNGNNNGLVPGKNMWHNLKEIRKCLLHRIPPVIADITYYVKVFVYTLPANARAQFLTFIHFLINLIEVKKWIEVITRILGQPLIHIL